MAVTPAILPLYKRLSYKQAKTVVIIAVCLGVLFSCLQIYIDFFIFQRDSDDNLQQMLELVKRPATQAIISRDEKLAREVLESLLSSNSVTRVELLDENKNNLTESREKKIIQSYGRQFYEMFFKRHELKEQPLYIRDTRKFGVLKITVDNYLVVNRSINRALAVLMSDLARNLLLAVFVLFLFHRIVTKPLFKMAIDLGTIDLSNPDTNRLSYLHNHNEDELGLLVTSINQLLNAIDEQITERERILQEMAIAKQAAEVANSAKSEFLTNMSHEMRTPLNAVLNMLFLVKDTHLTTTQQDFLETASHSGQVLLSLIDDILDFSKIETGEFNIESIPFNLRQVVEEALETLAQQAENKQLELLSLIAMEVPYQVKGDPKRLRQVITNLVNNAIKFTTEGEIIVSVSVVEINTQKITISCEVTDTGIGIPAQAQTSIFKLFEQVDGSTTRRYGGTGLGLTLCQQIVQQMVGEIGVDSTVGEGSTFWFTVELESVSNADTESPFPTKLTDNLRVLIVDSNAKLRHCLDYYLQQWGITVDGVDNAKQALECLQSAEQTDMPFDIALINLALPDLDGVSLGLMLKTDTRFVDTRLVLLTPYYFRPLSAKVFCDYLHKPIRQEKLYQTLNRVMQLPLPESFVQFKPFQVSLEARKSPARR
jgi:signal transduction histidine kinase/ActR/RegA family two-component response regulator